MPSNLEEADMYAPLVEPDPTNANRRLPVSRLTKVLLAAAGLFALAAVAITISMYETESDAPSFKQIPKAKPPRQMLNEVKIFAPEFTKLSTVRELNELLKSAILTDHKLVYDAIPASQWELLFDDFLSTIGSQTPDAAGAVGEPIRKHSTQTEHSHRFAQFQMNMLRILELNAEEYARNPTRSRARFGITVHADWTKEEFLTKRLNLRAANVSAYKEQALKAAKNSKANKARVTKARAAKAFKKSKANKARVTKARAAKASKFGNSTKGASLDDCSKTTGGTCYLLPCHADRGATCYEHHCVCGAQACAVDGKCTRPGGCPVATGGTCHFFGCDSSRGAECVGGDCICSVDSCAVDGACVVDADEPTEESDVDCTDVVQGTVRNQGSCGDCWAFSTAEQLRFMTLKKYDYDPGKMSVQYLVDCMPEVQSKSCDDGVKGCCGGLPYRADVWLAASGGLPTQEDYGPAHSDKHPFHKYKCKSEKPKTVTPSDDIHIYETEEETANGYCANGPVAIAINANDALEHYIGGIFTAAACPAEGINHAVVYAGVDQFFDDGNPVHVILNSWGTNWGVGTEAPYDSGGGHVLFKYGENVCNIEALATQPADVVLNDETARS